jgi:hypothetical protein
MITIPPRHYCVIENPAVKDDEGKPVYDDNSQIKLLHADQVIKISNTSWCTCPITYPTYLTVICNQQ